MANETLLKALAVTVELTHSEMSEAAVRVFAADLSEYPLDQVLGALKRCRQEVKGRLTIADVITRLDDGRPGSEEAWAMIPHDEQGSVVWTEEMAQAFGVCYRLIEHGEEIAARMAFKESYAKLVASARSTAEPVKWTPSLGRDLSLRAAALETAVAKHRLSTEHAQRLLPVPDASELILALAVPLARRLSNKVPADVVIEEVNG